MASPSFFVLEWSVPRRFHGLSQYLSDDSLSFWIYHTLLLLESFKIHRPKKTIVLGQFGLGS